jgi:hypothetical protein
MGLIDKKSFNIICPKCSNSELLEVSQKGSSFSAHWQDLPTSKLFDILLKQLEGEEPKVEKATCKDCNIEAKVAVG